jgi:hypothetical protein
MARSRHQTTTVPVFFIQRYGVKSHLWKATWSKLLESLGT